MVAQEVSEIQLVLFKKNFIFYSSFCTIFFLRVDAQKLDSRLFKDVLKPILFSQASDVFSLLVPFVCLV